MSRAGTHGASGRQAQASADASADPIVISDAELGDLIKALRSPSGADAVIAIAARLDSAEPVIAASDIRGVVGPEARIYFLQTDELLGALKAEVGAKLALLRGTARIWWPAITPRSSRGDHPLVIPVEGEDPTAVLAEFARQFDLSRPHVRREINQIEDARTLAEHERDEARRKDVKSAERLRDAHTERHREATRAETAEAELERAKRQLRAALGAGGARKEVGILTLGLDSTERAEVMSAFGKNLGLARRRAGLTHRELAARCFLTVNHAELLGRGKRLPSTLVLLNLTRALGVGAGDLMDGLEPPTREATRAHLRDLILNGPGSRSAGQLAEASQLPTAYVNTTLNYMEANGELLTREGGDWARAPQQPTNRARRR